MLASGSLQQFIDVAAGLVEKHCIIGRLRNRHIRCKLYATFHLILMVNHACNLRCAYCYTGRKFHRPMPRRMGRRAIARAFRTIRPGGQLELGFFGGEPLLEAEAILDWVQFAETCADRQKKHLRLNVTTNGTLLHESAWRVMTHPAVQLSISHDGMAAVNDRYRKTIEGRGVSETVVGTIERLLAANIEFDVVMVVRPETLHSMQAGIQFLWDLGVRHFVWSLDHWATWTVSEATELQQQIYLCASDWWQRLPNGSLNCFDEAFAHLTQLESSCSARCGFGVTQIAVAPSGSLYPCERLIGSDDSSNPSRLNGSTMMGRDFLHPTVATRQVDDNCQACVLQPQCSTSCCCTNYIRTGNPNRPDGLLCLFQQACTQAVARLLNSPQPVHRHGTAYLPNPLPLP